MIDTSTISIHIWDGDWGLPSIDANSLQLLSYIRFSGTEVNIKKSNDPFWTLKGTFPVVLYCGKEINDLSESQNLLKSINMSPDHTLTGKQIAETIAYTCLINENLYPALLYTLWLDQVNYQTLTKPWYRKTLNFPYNYIYPTKYWYQTYKFIHALYSSYGNEECIVDKIYSDAKKCITSLSYRLDHLDYMFGKNPTSIDATIFAYLAPLLKFPLKNNILKNHIKNCSNLNNFVTRILGQYFPKYCPEYPEYKEYIENTIINDIGIQLYKNNQYIAIFGMFIMIFYGFTTGKLRFYYSKPVLFATESNHTENKNQML